MTGARAAEPNAEIASLASEAVWPPSRREWIQFLASTSLALLSLAALLRANVYYWDDLGRAVDFAGWDMAARPIATYVFRLITGSGIYDFAPLSQIAGAIAVSLAAHVVAWRLFRIRDAIGCTATTLAIAISPYFLAIYAFRFDSVVYGIGFLLAVLAIFLLIERPGRFSPPAAFLLVLLSYGINPSVAGAGLVVIALLWCIRFIEHGEEPWDVLRAALWLIAFHLFAMLAVKLYASVMPVWGYTELHGGVTPGRIPANIIGQTLRIWSSISQDWNSSLLGYAFWTVLVGGIGSALIWWGSAIATTRPAATGAYAALLLFPVVLVLAYLFGPVHIHAVLDNPISSARTRTGFGLLVAASFVMLFRANASGQRSHRIGTRLLQGLAVAAIVWLMSFAAIFGNTLAIQTDFNKAILRQVHASLIELQQSAPMVRYATIVGEIRLPAGDSALYDQFAALKGLVPEYSKIDEPVPRMFLRLFASVIPTEVACTSRGKVGVPSGRPIRPGINFDVYVAGNCAIFVMKDPAPLKAKE